MKLQINDQNYVIPILYKKMTILELALKNGIYIPHFCYNSTLNIAGNCRICLVEVSKLVKPIISCLNVCMDNLQVFTNTFSLKKYRENVMEFLLINHPLDCPVCDQGGECDLQEQAKRFGLDHTRYSLLKKTNVNSMLNTSIKLVLNRCILCMRCVRFLSENTSNRYLGNVGRGVFSKISVYSENLALNEWNSANIIDICPVGALSIKVKQYTYRPWEITVLTAVDVYDIFGGMLDIHLVDNKVIRILPSLDRVLKVESISNLSRFNLLAYETLINAKPVLSISYTRVQPFEQISECFNVLGYGAKDLMEMKRFLTLNFYNKLKTFNFVHNIKAIPLNVLDTLGCFSKVFTLLSMSAKIGLYFVLKNCITAFRFVHKFRDLLLFVKTSDLNMFKKRINMFFQFYILQNMYNIKKFVFLQNYLQYYAILLQFDDILKYRFNAISPSTTIVNFINFYKIYSKSGLINVFKKKFSISFKSALYYNVLGQNLNNLKENLQVIDFLRSTNKSLSFITKLKTC